jgi:hypothetical protein
MSEEEEQEGAAMASKRCGERKLARMTHLLFHGLIALARLNPVASWRRARAVVHRLQLSRSGVSAKERHRISAALHRSSTQNSFILQRLRWP